MIKGFKSLKNFFCDIILYIFCFLLVEEIVYFYLLKFVIFVCCSEDDYIVENEFVGLFKRKRRFVFDVDMEIKIRDLYERYVLFDVLS